MSRRMVAARRQRRGRRSARRWKIVVLAAAALAIAAVSSWLLLAGSGEPSGPPKAVIVDQLSLTFPNPGFVENATETLEAAGYSVDYYSGEEVTVTFFRRLPTHGYDLVIMRAHAGRLHAGREVADETSLFTNEPYTATRHVEDQLDRNVGIAYYDPNDLRDLESGNVYFSIKPDFVRSSMLGDFDSATVILMGCDVLRGDALAEGFVAKGADAVVGWDGQVSANHTDSATERLLEHLVSGELSAEGAVVQTMAEMGPDPAFDSVLLSYSSDGSSGAGAGVLASIAGAVLVGGVSLGGAAWYARRRLIK